MEAPEKIYIHPDIGGREFLRPWLRRAANNESVEYTRTDVIVKRAEKYLHEHLVEYWSQRETDGSKFIEDFKKYIKGN